MRPQLCAPQQAGGQLIFRTADGRDVWVGRPATGGTELPGGRVNLYIGHPADGEDGASEALTPGEARQLATALLQQAAAAEDGPTECAASRVEVSYLGGESYAVATRGHALLTDQPATAGGADAAMTPTELFVASLSSCVAFYAGRYLARHGLDRSGLHVTAAFTTATDRPARVGKVKLTLQVPCGMPPGREAALLAVASHCTVHNTLRQAPEVAIELARP
jgi:putative redox protein